MIRTPVKSSYVKSIGHDGETMEVEHLSGKVYRYKGITPESYANARKQESIGRALRGIIQGKGVEVESVEPEIIVLDE